MTIKACVDCKHFKGTNPLYGVPEQNPECGHPKAGSRDPIYGKALCQNERNITRKGCGREGKLWEAKHSDTSK